jgi:DNA polymerase
MAEIKEELNQLLRDAMGHAEWLRESGEEVVLKPHGPVRLIRPGRDLATAASTSTTASSSSSAITASPRAVPIAQVATPTPSKPAPTPTPTPNRTSNPTPAPTPIPIPTPASAPVPGKAVQVSLLAGAPNKIGTSTDPVERLKEIRTELGDCKRCKLCKTRKTIVFGTGNPKAEVVFVGEAPGADEDRTGEPFVGAAGQLLTKMIEAMGLSRQQVYICNVIKCRPPGNRPPESDEITNCEPFLMAQLDAIKPKVIVTLGKFAAHALLRESTPITRLRGSWRTYQGIKLMPTFHPSYLLRSPNEKRKAWEDLQQVMKELGLKSKGD